MFLNLIDKKLQYSIFLFLIFRHYVIIYSTLLQQDPTFMKLVLQKTWYPEHFFWISIYDKPLRSKQTSKKVFLHSFILSQIISKVTSLKLKGFYCTRRRLRLSFKKWSLKHGILLYSYELHVIQIDIWFGCILLKNNKKLIRNQPVKFLLELVRSNLLPAVFWLVGEAFWSFPGIA